MSLFDRLVVTTLPVVPKFIVGHVASRYVAGETLDDAIREIKNLRSEGAIATIDLLGEEVYERRLASAALDKYLKVLAAVCEHELECYLSVKPSQLGMTIDQGFCRENFERLVEAASAEGVFVRLDMEDRHATGDTLSLFRHLRQEHELVGTVLQSYMRRTLGDIAELPPESNIRICKGIYIEPREAAWKGYETVRLNFVAALEQLFRAGAYVGIATHDEYLICAAVAMIDRLGIDKDRYEFQMLLGVEPRLRRILIDGGHRLRVYVPFGRFWYQYSMRRLRENPKIAGHVARAMLSGE